MARRLRRQLESITTNHRRAVAAGRRFDVVARPAAALLSAFA
jgi:hypothetical protein